VKIHVVVFWAVTPCGGVDDFTLKMEAAWSSEMLVSYHIITHSYNPQDYMNSSFTVFFLLSKFAELVYNRHTD
jgi:hypothetical protein